MTKSTAMAVYLAFACSVSVLGSCSREPVDRSRSVSASGSAASATVVYLPDLLEVVLPGPDRWEAVTNGRRLEYSPPAVLLLFGKKEPALIRISLYESVSATPKDLLQQISSKLVMAGFRCRRDLVPANNDDPASFAFIGPEPESRCGKVFVGRLPGDSRTSVVVIGQWSAASDNGMTADFDSIVASLRAAGR